MEVLRLPIGLLSLVGLDYWLGYWYSKAYFANFNISTMTTSIPIEQYFIKGAIVFVSGFLPETYLFHHYVLLFGAIVWAVALFAPTEQFKLARTAIAWLAAVAVVIAASYDAVRVAGRDVRKLASQRSIQLQLEDGAVAALAPAAGSPSAEAAPDILAELAQDNARDALRLVWQDANTTVVAVMNDRCVGTDDPCVARVYRVRAEEIRVSRWVPGDGREDEQ